MSEAGLWIPPKIWQDSGLSLVEKTILATVHSFHENGLDFFQSNHTISENLGVSESTVKRALQNLQNQSYITIAAFDGRKRKIELTAEVQNDLAGRSKRPSRKVKMTQQKGQNDPAARSKRPTTNNTTNNSKNKPKNKGKKERFELLMPFEDFESIWAEWCEYKWTQHRFKYKSPKTEQAALHHLQKISNHDRTTAIEIIGTSVANGYQGLFAKRNSAAPTQPSADQFAEYIKSGTVSK